MSGGEPGPNPAPGTATALTTGLISDRNLNVVSVRGAAVAHK